MTDKSYVKIYQPGESNHSNRNTASHLLYGMMLVFID
jgi:hypothetical protein